MRLSLLRSSAAVVVAPSVHDAVSSAVVAALSTHVGVAATSSAIGVASREPTFTTLVAALIIVTVTLSVTLMSVAVYSLVLFQPR